MVKRGVKLAQVVCAVYSLNKPIGASKKEITSFLKLRYGITCTKKEIDKVLEKGLDEGFLTIFSQRYSVAKIRHGIHWTGDTSVIRVSKRKGRGGKRRRSKPKSQRKRSPKRKTNNFSRGKVIVQDCVKQTTCFYTLWKNELKKQYGKMRKRVTNISKRGKSVFKKVKNGKKQKWRRLKLKMERASTSASTKCKRGKIERMKKALRLKRSVKTKRSTTTTSLKRSVKTKRSKTTISKRERQVKSRKSSKVSTDSVGEPSGSERYRSLLRQTKHAVVHGKSWDKLNFTRQKSMRENQEMVKNSQLVQKILTKAHAASWDDLNSKLKEMKKKPNTCPQEGRAFGDGASQHSLTSVS